ncbi:MAG TPA: sigma-70 family RNA polymerase sigma factor [Solirubrobacteraceae bacterium]|nr:sigma-70 family RNA polymerase sigma factor [Solirubrobacteraceae bacterium]
MTNDEQKLLDAARHRDERAFSQLIGSHRPALHAHCYRMLGSVQDAEDALQETLLNAWRALPRFEGRSSLKSWLYRIATNACLKMIERRPRRVLPIDYGPQADPHDPLAKPLVESVWIEPYPDFGLESQDRLASPDAHYEQRESVELAFVAALQHIPARQRAVLVLRDVLGFSAKEVAETLEMTPAAVDTSLQRAHRTVDERLPERSQQATLQELGDERLRELVGGFVAAWERADVDSVVAMLAHDVTLTMPPQPTWYRGRVAVTTFLRTVALAAGTRWRLLPVTANGQLAFGEYRWNETTERFVARAVMVLTIADAMIAEITAFGIPELFANFGLPERLEP